MEISFPPDPKDACFWYPADLVCKQEGLCLHSPPTKQQNKTVNCNLTEWVREEYELGMQQKSWDSAQQRWKWDTDGRSL